MLAAAKRAVPSASDRAAKSPPSEAFADPKGERLSAAPLPGRAARRQDLLASRLRVDTWQARP